VPARARLATAARSSAEHGRCSADASASSALASAAAGGVVVELLVDVLVLLLVVEVSQAPHCRVTESPIAARSTMSASVAMT